MQAAIKLSKNNISIYLLNLASRPVMTKAIKTITPTGKVPTTGKLSTGVARPDKKSALIPPRNTITKNKGSTTSIIA